jgi:hypothetical protein
MGVHYPSALETTATKSGPEVKAKCRIPANLEWFDRALDSLFERTPAEKADAEQEAIAVCLGCPLRQGCLARALERGERYGVWGGTTERQRRSLLRLAHLEDQEVAA